MGPVYWLDYPFQGVQVVEGSIERESQGRVGHMATPIGSKESYLIKWYYVTREQAVEAAIKHCEYQIGRWTKRVKELQL